MPRSYEDISFVSTQDGRDSPLPLTSQPDSTPPSPITGTKPKKGVKEEEEKGEKEVEENKKGEEKKDRERGEEEKGDENLTINYDASRVSKMAKGRIRNRSSPYSLSSSSRSRRSVGVQTSSSNSSRSSSSSTPTSWNHFSDGTTKIYKLCCCKDPFVPKIIINIRK